MTALQNKMKIVETVVRFWTEVEDGVDPGTLSLGPIDFQYLRRPDGMSLYVGSVKTEILVPFRETDVRWRTQPEGNEPEVNERLGLT